MVPNVFGIGSCRVLRPLRRLAALGDISLSNERSPMWFTHSSGEALQYVRALAGQANIPSELRPFVCESPVGLPVGDGALGASAVTSGAFLADVAVVEVSTLKTLHVADTCLNYHLVWGEAERLGINSRRLLEADTSELPQSHPLRGLRAGRATAEDVEEDLGAIRALARVPTLVVDHMWIPMPNGEVAAERVEIAEALASISGSTPIGYWSTREILRDRGTSAAKDHNHWSSDHEEAVGDSIVTAGLRLVPSFD